MCVNVGVGSNMTAKDSMSVLLTLSFLTAKEKRSVTCLSSAKRGKLRSATRSLASEKGPLCAGCLAVRRFRAVCLCPPRGLRQL